MGTRRHFTPEYRRDVATLVLDSGSSIASVARDLGLGESVVGRWVTLERERRQAVREGRPDPRELEAENTAPSRRVRQLEKEKRVFGKSQRLLRLRAPKHQRFELMDAHKGFLLNHLDGQGLGYHASRLLRVEKPSVPQGPARARAAAFG